MTTNPYEDDPTPYEEPPARASGLAVLSLLCSLISLVTCCIGGIAGWAVDQRIALVILPLPILSILGITLGWTAFLRAKRSTVPIMGRNAAIMGIFLGLIAILAQGSAISGVLLVYSPLKQKLAPTLSTFATNAAQDDTTALRATLEPATAAALDDQRLERFLDTTGARTTAWSGASIELTMIRHTHTLIGEAQDRGFATGDQPEAHAWPLWIDTPTGRITTLVFLEDESLSKGTVLLKDVLVLLEDWQAAPLLPNGPASEFATYLGMQDATR